MGYSTPEAQDACPWCENPDCPATEERDCPDYEYEKSIYDGEQEDEENEDD